ncbi:FAD binding domain-containing protein [Achromobacter anxifer]|uniref:Caffeine dehydrogenase subunit beta n=1 Tax=Achromobacter anxifer TaxID=1287737 RepID=A0A6S7ES57_9BURK|nr:FAD binding domain-containing protein [Achromobacter anxifer]MDF8362078.1 FAD binding domain-containing protein [Achromobacter anxifer]CAB3924261.1 Caffeine dehydrogenase subunit beta [Achromobacter anxifer]CAB5517499.1 Caffeine dehydrogenase subunit beta [Achromobacter anxifer]
MKAAAFEYTRPDTLQDALRALRGHEGRAKLMAGGQSLGPMLNLRLARPPVVIDISGLSELRTVSRQDGKLRVGAAVTHAEIEDGVHELLRGTPLQQVAPGIAYRAIRNRGTLGGSLAHADPAADWVLTVVGLGATLEIAGPDGVRMLPAEDYMQGAYTTGLREDELIAAVHIPEAGPQARWGYYKFCRKTGEFAEASCAAWFDPSSKTARIAVGALDGAPRLLPQLAARIAQQGLAGLDETLLAAELAGVMQDKDEHHRKLHGTAVTRCLAQALG